MRIRAMRIIVFFDLPVETKNDRRQYTLFRNYILDQGFIMLQKSVYSKIVLNRSASETVMKNLRLNKPKSGNVQLLLISERQFQNIEFIVGEGQKEVVDSGDRLVYL